MANLSVSGLSKRFGETHALSALDLDIRSGEFVAVIGPSGCGKTTLLRLVAGFEHVDAGTIHFGDELQASPTVHRPPEERGIGMVFQSYALWPHMNVAENVGYPLRVRATAPPERAERVAVALRQVGLEHLAERRPAELSGGQRQRVALARCLVMEPAVVLFDEPLANLDVHLRESMQTRFRDFHRDSGATILYVTHDQGEAMALADRVVVLDHGVVQQVAPPRDIFAAPRTAMVARFVGHGMVVPVNVDDLDADGSCQASLHGVSLRLRIGTGRRGAAFACLRAEQLALSAPGPEALEGTVVDSVYRGPYSGVSVRLSGDGEHTLTVNTASHPPAAGTTVGVRVLDGWVLEDAATTDEGRRSG